MMRTHVIGSKENIGEEGWGVGGGMGRGGAGGGRGGIWETYMKWWKHVKHNEQKQMLKDKMTQKGT